VDPVREVVGRDDGADPLRDTLNHLQKGDDRRWELALADGIYDVWLLSSDPSYSDQVNDFVIEGVAVDDPDGMDHVDEFLVTVEVTDGRLTVAPAASAQNAKISAIEVLAVPSSSN